MDPQDVSRYYHHLFPVDIVFDFLRLVTGVDLDTRERICHEDFCFIRNGEWTRSLSFTKQSLKACLLNQTPPDEIHFSAIYHLPAFLRAENDKKRMVAAFPRKFEIDLNDIDRGCCGLEKKVCEVCWNEYAIGIVSVIEGGYAGWGMTRRPAFFFSGNKSLYIFITCPIFSKLPPEDLLDFLKKRIEEKIKNVKFDEKVPPYHHALKLPFSLNSKKGRIVRPITKSFRTLSQLSHDLSYFARKKEIAISTKFASNEWDKIIKEFKEEILDG